MRHGYTVLSQNVRVITESIQASKIANDWHCLKITNHGDSLLCYFFGNKGQRHANLCAKGKPITGNFYLNVVLKN